MQLLCFDLDNTLVRSTQAHLDAFQNAFQKNKLPQKTRKDILLYFSLESSELVKRLYPQLSERQIQKIVVDHDKYFLTKSAQHIRAIQGVRGTLKKLKKDFMIAILSNCTHKEIQAILRSACIDKSLFDILLGNDDVKHPKPAPDEIIKAEHLLHQKNATVIGDSIYDIRAGKKAKVKTIAVLTGPHTRMQLEKEKPWKIIKSIRELPRILKTNKSTE